MNEHETTEDIIAEMLGAKTEFPFVYLMGEPDTPEVTDTKTKEIIAPRKINIRYVTVKELANRLEAAHERESTAAKDVARQLRAWAAQIDPFSKDGTAPQRLRALAAKLEGGAK